MNASTFAIFPPLMRLCLLSFGVIAIVALPGCGKDDAPEPSPAPSGTPSPQGPDAILIASLNTLGTTDEVGYAFFLDEQGEHMVDVGTVTLNGIALEGHEPYLTPTPSSLDLASGSEWNVAGGSGYSSFTVSPALVFPSVGALNGASTVDISEGYALSAAVADADSISFSLNGSVLNTYAPNGDGTATMTFPTWFLSGYPPNTSGIVTVQARTYEDRTIDGRTIRFIHSRSVSMNVTIAA